MDASIILAASILEFDSDPDALGKRRLTDEPDLALASIGELDDLAHSYVRHFERPEGMFRVITGEFHREAVATILLGLGLGLLGLKPTGRTNRGSGILGKRFDPQLYCIGRLVVSSGSWERLVVAELVGEC